MEADRLRKGPSCAMDLLVDGSTADSGAGLSGSEITLSPHVSPHNTSSVDRT
jgi:hypothetical protein